MSSIVSFFMTTSFGKLRHAAKAFRVLSARGESTSVLATLLEPISKRI